MPGGGFQRPDWFGSNNTGTAQPAAPTTSYGNPNSFTTAANQQAKDYDTIMQQYKDLGAQSQLNPIVAGKANFSPISPQIAPYQEDDRSKQAISNLQELSQTGGYSQQGIQDLRERGVSPVRSIYASANRNLQRAKGLSGGYSPNFGALTAKMAREMSDEIGQRLTDVNAGIAQNVASNRLSVAPQYAGAAQRANEDQTAANQRNADIFNDTNKFNAGSALDASKFNADAFMNAQRTNFGNRLGAIQGQANLYGTTPALTNLFGQQVSNARGLNQNQQQIDNQKLGTMLGGLRY
jgi:hypothetical protein